VPFGYLKGNDFIKISETENQLFLLISTVTGFDLVECALKLTKKKVNGVITMIMKQGIMPTFHICPKLFLPFPKKKSYINQNVIYKNKCQR